MLSVCAMMNCEDSSSLRQSPVFRMSLQNMRDITAKRNNSQVLLTRHIEPEKHDSFGEAVPSKLRRYLAYG